MDLLLDIKRSDEYLLMDKWELEEDRVKSIFALVKSFEIDFQVRVECKWMLEASWANHLVLLMNCEP